MPASPFLLVRGGGRAFAHFKILPRIDHTDANSLYSLTLFKTRVLVNSYSSFFMNLPSKFPTISVRTMFLTGIILSVMLVAALLVRESLDQEMEIRASLQAPVHPSRGATEVAVAKARSHDQRVSPSPKSAASPTQQPSASGTAAAEMPSLTLQEEEPPPQALPTPAVYADPEKLGEVTEHDEEMYNRSLQQFTERMRSVTAPSDSPEYREQFQKASEEGENTMRALMGHDAFIKMQAASERGETVK